MSYLRDYLFYNEGNECPREYHVWSALTLLSAVVGPRIYFDDVSEDGYSQLRYYLNIYVTLVGVQGGRKSFAKDVARDLALEVCKTLPLSASVDTRENICKQMSSPEFERCYKNGSDELISYRPYFFVINELKNFISVDPARLIDFWVDIYDRVGKVYDVRTKNKGSDFIENPYIVILACATTEYIVDQLRERIMSGGLSRRMIFVNHYHETKRIAQPRVPPGGHAAWQRVKQHLERIQEFKGQMFWSPDAQAAYNHWYNNLKFPSDPLLAGFYRSKHVQVIKVAMALAASEHEPKHEMTVDQFNFALELVTATEDGMVKLFASAGRNILAGPTQGVLDLLEAHGGLLPEKQLRALINRDLDPMASYNVLRHLKETEQVYYHAKADPNGTVRTFIYNRATYERLIKATTTPNA